MLSLWEKESFFAPADIAIAGSGFAGLWSAFYLKKKHPGLRITMVDRGIIPTGASTRNAGFACFGSATELLHDAAVMGLENMLSLVEMRYKGIRRIRRLFGKKEIGYDPCGGYELITDQDSDTYKELKAQVKWLNRELSAILPTKKNFSFADKSVSKLGLAQVRHLLYSPLEAALHPGKLCEALLRRVQTMGVRLIPATEILGYEESAAGVRLQLERNLELDTAKLLVCTNGFAAKLLPSLEVIPARGQVLVTAPIPSLKLKGTFHAQEGYYYFRNIGNRLLIGGARNSFMADETTTSMDTSTQVQQALEFFLQKHLLPGVPYEVTDRWSGIMGMGPEKMPIVRKVGEHTYCAVRMSGMGVALAPMIGEMVAELL